MADPTTTDSQTRIESPWAPWLSRIAAARTRREDRLKDWQENVDRRSGYANKATDHYDRISLRTTSGVSVNQDAPLTKAKIAQLYSQTPEVRLTPRWPEFEQATSTFGRELNDTITECGVGTTIEEILADVVNASGIGGVLVTCEKRTEPREAPTIDPATLSPEQQAAVMAGQMEIPTETVEHILDQQYLVDRKSPADLLIPSDFTGSDYDKARWLGCDGRMTWPQAIVELKPDGANRGLTEADKDAVLGGDRRAGGTTNTLNTDGAKFRDTDVVAYQQIFYWRHFYHADETNFKALQRLVFVDGIDEPVINEPYRAQKRSDDGRILGVVRNPIRILTLTYISDECLPPSDSTISRRAIMELEDSRADMALQRKHSIPIRWFNSNLVGSNTRSLLEKGEFQGFIPVNGTGDRAIGEVARASFPPEKYEFDKVIKNEITEQWQVGTNQTGAFASGERSAREAGIIERNFQRRVGQEQDKVTKFFLGIAEVLAGHLSIYGPPSGQPDETGPAREMLATGFTYSVAVDSTVRLDAEQQIEQLTRALNLTAQSGYVNPKWAIARIWELSGVDPALVVIDPQPKAPEPVKVSISKAEDIINPIMLAALMHTQQAPTPEELAAAITMLQTAIAGGVPLVPPTPASDAPPRDVETPGQANSGWDTAPRIERRAEDGGA